MEETELLEFLDYITKEEMRLKEELKYYFELEQERERAGMNLYGIGTPRDKTNLEEKARVDQLKYLAMRVSTFSELVDFIDQGLTLATVQEKKEHYEKLKEMITTFQQRKEEESKHHK